MNVVTPDGKRPAAAGRIVLYQLKNGMTLYAEAVEIDESGAAYVFETRRTLVVTLTPKGGNAVDYTLTRADRGLLFGPTTLRVPVSSLTFAQDVTDDAFLRKCGEALSGIAFPASLPGRAN